MESGFFRKIKGVKLTNTSWVSDRPTCLTFCCNKMSKNAEWLKRYCCFFIHSYCHVSANRTQSDESWLSKAMLRYSLTSRQQRYDTRTPKSIFFDYLISHLDFLELRKSVWKPFVYGYSGTFMKRIKKWNRDNLFCLIPINKKYKLQAWEFLPLLSARWCAEWKGKRIFKGNGYKKSDFTACSTKGSWQSKSDKSFFWK